MQYDIWKFVFILAGSGLAGLVVGHPLLILLATTLGIIAWQIYRLQRLYQWVSKPRENSLPESNGQFYLLHREINRRNIKDRNRKRTLANYLNQFRRAVSTLPDAIILLDDFGKIEWANKNADAIFGIRWPEDANVRFADLVRDPEVDQLLRAELLTEHKTDTDPKDSAQQGIEINSKKEPDHIINIKVIRYTNRLRMVIARDVSRLVKINQMQSDFVANVSHELKTPLTVLKGYVEILEDSSLFPEKLRKPLDQMSVQSERMQLIVNDLLYLAKLEDRGHQPEHQSVDVSSIVNSIIETVHDKAQTFSHKLEFEIDSSIKLFGKPSELHAAFSNLIFNAINYTPPKGIIKIHWRRNKNGGASFIVKDNGEGIPPQHISRLTQRFYRIDSDRSREGGGTGLGLAIVKHVLQRHEATLEIDSTIGKGSEFRCNFPSFKLQNSE